MIQQVLNKYKTFFFYKFLVLSTRYIYMEKKLNTMYKFFYFKCKISVHKTGK